MTRQSDPLAVIVYAFVAVAALAVILIAWWLL